LTKRLYRPQVASVSDSHFAEATLGELSPHSKPRLPLQLETHYSSMFYVFDLVVVTKSRPISNCDAIVARVDVGSWQPTCWSWAA